MISQWTKYAVYSDNEDEIDDLMNDCLPERRVANQFEKSVSAFDNYEQVINLDVLIEILVQQSNLSIRNKTGGSFSPISRK